MLSVLRVTHQTENNSCLIKLYCGVPLKLICWFSRVGCLCLHSWLVSGSFMGKENQYIQLVKGLYCKMLTIGKQLPTFPHRILGLNHSPQRWEASVSQQTLPT